MKHFIVCFLILVSGFTLSANAEPEEKENVAGGIFSVPKKVAGVVCGVSLGVPIRVVRDIKLETRRMAGVLRQDFGNDFGIASNILIATMSIPYGLLSGMIKGSIHGVQYGIEYGAKQPFSPESFSWTDAESNNNRSQN
jgi:hypothetical protein